MVSKVDLGPLFQSLRHMIHDAISVVRKALHHDYEHLAQWPVILLETREQIIKKRREQTPTIPFTGVSDGLASSHLDIFSKGVATSW